MQYLAIPPTQPTDNATTLVVLHGYGTNELDLVPIAEQLQPPPGPRLETAGEFLIISLRAPIELGSSFGGGSNAWYHLVQLPSGLAPDDYSRHESEEMLVQELAKIITSEGGDPKNIILLGFSQGSAVIYSLLTTYNLEQYGLKVRAAIAMSGYIPRDVVEAVAEKDFAGLPMFLSHGEFDDLVPAQALSEAEALLTNANAAVTAKMYNCGHGVLPQTVEDIKAWLATLFD
jgi:phospholipase/carboxylesterase